MSARPFKSSTSQSGVALVTVILIIALLTAIVSRLSLVNQIWIRQVDNNNALVQASQATRAAQIWVSSILEDDTNGYDALTENWAQPIIPIPIAWGEMFGRVEDMQSRFNVNNLIDDSGKTNIKALEQFKQLLLALELDPGIEEAIIDWIDTDSIPYGTKGAEDVYYLIQENPYLAANRPFVDEQELRLVRGIDMAAWNKLEPFITTLPGFTPVNVNTASAEVLAAMLYNPDSPSNLKNEVASLVEDIQTNPFSNFEDFSTMVNERLNINTFEGLTVSSEYFKAYTDMTFGNVEQRMITLYQRKSGRASILQQSRTLF
jgi:general secretion pathway protein K